MDGKEALRRCIDNSVLFSERVDARAYVAQLERERDEAVAITKGAIAMSAPLVEQVNKLRAELAALRREEPTK